METTEKESKSTKGKKGPKPGERGVRYTPVEKAKILKFIEDYDAENGRGGQSAAAKKYGVSQLTLINWKKSDGKPGKVAKPAKGGSAKVGKKRGRKPGKAKASLKVKKGKRGRKPGKALKAGKASGLAGKVTSILKEMEANEREIAKLTASSESLKQKLKAAIG